MRFWQRVVLILAVTVLLPIAATGEMISIDEGVTIDLDLAEGRWQVFRQAPGFLVAETAEHLRYEAAAQGKTETEVRQAAEKRLAVNEAFVCNPASCACLMIDFSPLRQGERAPSPRAVATSARYAAEGLAEEEGIADLRHEEKACVVAGADLAYRVDASYRQHGNARQFIGIIGFLDPSWFFLYYTDLQRDPADFPEMERVLESATLRRGR